MNRYFIYPVNGSRPLAEFTTREKAEEWIKIQNAYDEIHDRHHLIYGIHVVSVDPIDAIKWYGKGK